MGVGLVGVREVRPRLDFERARETPLPDVWARDAVMGGSLSMRYRVRLQLSNGLMDCVYLDDDRRVTSAPDGLSWALYCRWDDVRGEAIDRCNCVVLGEERI